MKTKIILGSLFVLTLLLVMPSLPAIQNKIIIKENKHDCREFNIKDMLQLKIPIKFPLVFLLILVIYQFRWTRSELLFELATAPDPLPPGYKVVKPLLLFRGIMLFLTATLRFDFWIMISDYLGWGWLE